MRADSNRTNDRKYRTNCHKYRELSVPISEDQFRYQTIRSNIGLLVPILEVSDVLEVLWSEQGPSAHVSVHMSLKYTPRQESKRGQSKHRSCERAPWRVNGDQPIIFAGTKRPGKGPVPE